MKVEAAWLFVCQPRRDPLPVPPSPPTPHPVSSQLTLPSLEGEKARATTLCKGACVRCACSVIYTHSHLHTYIYACMGATMCCTLQTSPLPPPPFFSFNGYEANTKGEHCASSPMQNVSYLRVCMYFLNVCVWIFESMTSNARMCVEMCMANFKSTYVDFVI